LAHHGQGQWNGVAIASRGTITDVVTNFGQPLEPERTPDAPDDEPLAEARMIAASVEGVRVVSIYAPNGRIVDSPFYHAKLAWYGRLAQWLERAADPSEPLVIGGDFNVAPEDRDVARPEEWRGSVLCHEDARLALRQVMDWGLVDTIRLHHEGPGPFSWWDYRMLGFPKGNGLRIDHVVVTKPLVSRCTGAWIDREERKGKLPSDHAPVVVDLS
jgi:exodeoxyribonuclease III